MPKSWEYVLTSGPPERRFHEASRRWTGCGAPGRVHELAKASATADIGQNPTSVGGAPGGAGPYVTGAAHPGWRAPLGTPVVRGQAPSQRVCQGSLASSQGASQTPGASRRSIAPPRRGEEKGETARPRRKEQGQRSIGSDDEEDRSSKDEHLSMPNSWRK